LDKTSGTTILDFITFLADPKTNHPLHFDDPPTPQTARLWRSGSGFNLPLMSSDPRSNHLPFTFARDHQVTLEGGG
jgi:hypothetical protein